MTEVPPASAPLHRSRLHLIEAARQNPVVLKELRARMRGGRAFIVITVYLFLLAGLVGLIYFSFLASQNSPGSIGIDARQVLGKSVFAVVVGLELMVVSFIAPALTASAISGEREHQTYDLLRTTLLSARSLVLGKLFSSLSFILLLLFAAFPLHSLAYLFGGVAMTEILITSLILIVTAVGFSALGLFFSSFIHRTLVSTVLAYSTAILIVFGIPMLIFTTLLMFQSMLFGSTRPISTLFETVLLLAGWLIVSINPPATVLATELILMDNQSLWYARIPLPASGNQLYLVSPWILFTLIYLASSALLVVLSIYFVRRVEK